MPATTVRTKRTNLVLKRKPGQSIEIDGSTKVTIVGSGAAGTRLLVQAPREVSVRRSERVER